MLQLRASSQRVGTTVMKWWILLPRLQATSRSRSITTASTDSTSTSVSPGVFRNRLQERDARAKRASLNFLRTPEPACQRCRTDRVALAWTRIAGSSTGATDPEVAMLVAKDVAARARGELRPAAFEGPTCGRRSDRILR